MSNAAGAMVTASLPVTVADATKVRVYADADTYVQSSTPGSNYGNVYGMLVKPSIKGSPDRVGYLHFDLSPLVGKRVLSAVLNTESVVTDSIATPATERIDAHVASGSWSESNLTYPDRPTLGATVGSFVVDRTKKWTQANVSGAIVDAAKAGTTDLTLGLTQDDAGDTALLTTVSSRDSGAGAYIDVELKPTALEITDAVASSTATGTAAATYDGDTTTAWSTEANPTTIRYQLAAPAHVASMALFWKANTAQKSVFEVETSNDATTWTPRYAGQYVGPDAKQVVSLGTGVSVRYVRVTVHGDGDQVTTSALNEVRLYGYDATTLIPVVPPMVLKSVAVDGLGSTMNLGSTTQAVATARDSLGGAMQADLAWTSSNPDVAAVAPDGTVTAAATGTATITVTATAATETASATVPVTVVDPLRVRLYATADTYVESSTSGTAYGSQYGMLVKPSTGGSADRIGLVKFDVSSLAGAKVTSAVLTTESVISSGTADLDTVRVDAHAVTGDWDESTTYDSRPSLGSTVGSFLTTRTKATSSADLTAYVGSLAAGSKATMSLGLTQDDGTGIRLLTVSSRESGKGAYLDVTLDPAPAAAVPPAYLRSVALSGLGSSLEIGATAQATASVKDSLGAPLGRGDVVWTSSNPAVATVTPDGQVAGLVDGTTTISASVTADGLTATDSVALKVVDATRVRLLPTADTYVESSNPGTAFGAQYGMLVKPPVNGSADRTALMAFDLSSLAGRKVTSAVLTTENVITDGTTTPDAVRVDAHAVTDPWDESTTYASRPALGSTVASFVSSRTKATTSADLSAYVGGLVDGGKASMALGLTQDDAGSAARLVTVSTKESGKGAYLDVTLDPAPAGTLPPTYLKTVALGGLGATLDLGSTTRAKATVKDSLGGSLTRADLAWTSSNPAVASVGGDGQVAGLTEGTATITVTASADGLTATDSVSLKVADATRVRLYASADTYVESSSAGSSYGGQYGMLVKPPVNGSADRVGLLKFDLSPLAGKKISSAVLTTENVITDGTTTPNTVRVDAHAVTDGWTEATTYSSRPALGSTVASFLSSRTKATTSADLTTYVGSLAAGSTATLSLGLTQDDAGSLARLVTVSTKESGKGAYLDVVLDPAPAATLPPTYLKSVSLGGLATSLDLAKTTAARATVKDSLGNAFTRADVAWTSSNPAVASVSSDGKVTAAAVGSATISVTATADGLSATDTLAVKVVDNSKIRLYAQADTYVQSSTPTSNYGTATGMLVKPSVNGSPDRVGYLRFDLSALAGKTVTSATLTTESVISDGATSPSTVRIDVHSATGAWTETGMTYPNRPVLGPTLGGFVAERTKKTAATDLTGSVKSLADSGAGSLTLGLTQDSATSSALLATVSSRESSSKGAYIDVVVDTTTAG